MKRALLILFALALVACAGFAQPYEILYRDTFTLLYDEPVDMPELLSGESAEYGIWLWDTSQGVPVVTSTTGWDFYARTLELSQYVITPADPRLEYAVGVELILIRADGAEEVSDFAVTTNPDDIDTEGFPGVPFTYAPDSPFLAIPKVRNLRDSGM